MITVSQRQSLLDLALQYGGSMEAAMEIAAINGVSITDDLQDGQQLAMPVPQNRDVTNYYVIHDICPATSITKDAINEIIGSGEGIGYWAIGIDFVVS